MWSIKHIKHISSKQLLRPHKKSTVSYKSEHSKASKNIKNWDFEIVYLQLDVFWIHLYNILFWGRYLTSHKSSTLYSLAMFCIQPMWSAMDWCYKFLFHNIIIQFYKITNLVTNFLTSCYEYQLLQQLMLSISVKILIY